MKKMLFVLMIALLGAGTAGMHSCRKDQPLGKNPGENLVPGSDAEIEQRIRAFKQECEFLARNPGVKISSMMTYDDALWLMEASLNYSYSFPGETSQVSRVDSCKLFIPKCGTDSVSLTDVAHSYARMVDSIYQMYMATNWDDKHVLLSDLSMSDLADPAGYTVKLSVTLGKSTEELVPFCNPFNETDYWFWGGLQGKCGPYFPAGYGSDACKQIEQYQHWFQPHIEVEPGFHIFFTDIEEVQANPIDYLNPDDVTPNDNMLDYLLFSSNPTWPNFHDCLDPSEMWFYLKSLYTLVTDPAYAPSLTHPANKDFISVSLQQNFSAEQSIYHSAKIKYGIRHISDDPILPVAVNEL